MADGGLVVRVLVAGRAGSGMAGAGRAVVGRRRRRRVDGGGRRGVHDGHALRRLADAHVALQVVRATAACSAALVHGQVTSVTVRRGRVRGPVHQVIVVVDGRLGDDLVVRRLAVAASAAATTTAVALERAHGRQHQRQHGRHQRLARHGGQRRERDSRQRAGRPQGRVHPVLLAPSCVNNKGNSYNYYYDYYFSECLKKLFLFTKFVQ